MNPQAERVISRSLSGFLCGTHSGTRSRTSDRLNPDQLTAAHRELELTTDGERVVLGTEPWAQEPRVARLAAELTRILDRPHLLELVIFGSQAHGGTTGFSDVDAILVISDEAADDPDVLRDLRPPILAAQRAVIRHQPMQHHGFEVATPRLLLRAEGAVQLPRSALAESRSLLGKAQDAWFPRTSELDGAEMFGRLAIQALATTVWPTHPWEAHTAISTFELLPTAYLQARGTFVPKAESFGRLEVEFGQAWWPYEVLREVRSHWPRMRAPELRAGLLICRNPWLAVAAWRRWPRGLPATIAHLLGSESLDGLHRLVTRMRENITATAHPA